ncbi:MAG: diguanylate cyclase with sensor [Burkholderiaceae bacterium]|nr:diguanylate cyclase with sensor [Burkholderiaceae bacterium]
MTDNLALWRFAYVLPNLLACFGMAFVAMLVWRFRKQRGGLLLWLVAVTAVCWAFGEGAGFVGLPPGGILFVWKIGYFGVALTPLVTVLFAIEYVGHGHLLTTRRVLSLSILPVATLLAAWTNEWHGWIWATVKMDMSTPIPTLANTHGPLLWIYAAYCNLLALVTGGFLARRLGELQPPQRRQIYLLIASLALPLVANGLYMMRLVPMRNMDLTPAAFIVVVFVFIRSLQRERMFELAPVTAHEIYRSLEDAVFVVDDADRLQDLNGPAHHLLPPSPMENIGQPLAVLLPQARELLRSAAGEHRGEVALGEHFYDVRVAPLNNADGRFSGRLLVWREITERKRLEAELRRLATTDSLTGLFNRRHFLARGEEEIDRARRYGQPLSLIMVDIDHFKLVNDTLGHEAGDRVLLALAAILTAQSRASDCVGRLGGEEFALLLPQADSAAARQAGLRLLDAVSAARVAIEDGSQLDFSVSAGVTTMQADDLAMRALLRRADDALYQAKREGRNRLVVE